LRGPSAIGGGLLLSKGGFGTMAGAASTTAGAGAGAGGGTTGFSIWFFGGA
jgi:hypothetical protein